MLLLLSTHNIRLFEVLKENYFLTCIPFSWLTFIFSVTGDNEGRKVNRNGLKAAEMFCRIESLTPSTDPFTWLFIRPPWSLNGACCKECVFNYMKDYVKKVGKNSSSQFC